MRQKSILGFPPNVFFLSLVSFLNDIGGETIKKTIPLFLTNVLGAPATVVGLIEGIASATPQLLQPVSGYFSDTMHARKPIVVLGQILRSFILLLLWATTWPSILFIRFLDRSGKGVADAPRDALVADSADAGHVGRAFGLTRMFDNGGAVVGLIAASAILLYTQRNAATLTAATFRSIVLLVVIPLIVNVIILALFVHDAPRRTKEKLSVRFHNNLGVKFYLFLALSFLFTLGNSSDAFIVLKAQLVGLPVWKIFLLLAGYSLVSSLSALPFSSLSDRIGRKTLLVVGWLFYAVVYAAIARTSTAAAMVFFSLVYGLYYGLTEGSARAYIADIVVARRHATAYGIYNMVTGVTLFVASVLGGFFWQTIAPSATFYFGSIMAAAAASGLLLLL